MKTWIKNVRRIASGNQLVPCELLLEDGVILQLAVLDGSGADQIIDGQGACILPGFVDVHVHLREPGFEYKETIESGSKAAAHGGYTTIMAMPNTKPVMDSPERVNHFYDIAKRDACVNVYTYGCITHDLRSDELTDFAGMKQAGVIALTNDGAGVQTAGTMYRAMQAAAELDLMIVAHTEEDSLLFGGVMHEGIRNHELGLPGMLGLTESVQIARDVLLAGKTGVRYHICHISDRQSVQMLAWGKQQGFKVSGEVTPHHLLLSEMDIPGDDGAYKMNPPMRSKDDRAALIQGLRDGTIDCIATDHAPHSASEKDNGFMNSAFGITGLETAFPLLYTNLVLSGEATLEELSDWMSRKPGDLFGLPKGGLRVGAPADLTLVHLDHEVTFDEGFFKSKSLNTPFLQHRAKGEILMTIVGGKVVYE